MQKATPAKEKETQNTNQHKQGHLHLALDFATKYYLENLNREQNRDKPLATNLIKYK